LPVALRQDEAVLRIPCRGAGARRRSAARMDRPGVCGRSVRLGQSQRAGDGVVDYRNTHLDKGSVYDATIAGLPWDAYMARWEAAYLREVVPALVRGAGRYLDFACGTG